MTKEQEELLLTTARILRAHVRRAEPGPVLDREALEDVRALNEALRPFESNARALHPNQYNS